MRTPRFWLPPLLLGCSVLIAVAAPPAWWSQRGATNSQSADDYAVANLGQLKHMTTKAADELNATLPGGAGADINNLVASWDPNTPNPARDDYAALNQGQLKFVASLFYRRLAAFAYKGQPLPINQYYPWTSTESDDDAYALVNIGQLKYTFSFSLAGQFLDSYGGDSDMDGISNGWEIEHGLNPNDGTDAVLIVNGFANIIRYQQSVGSSTDPTTANPAELIVYTP